jgi:hypothetical protein
MSLLRCSFGLAAAVAFVVTLPACAPQGPAAEVPEPLQHIAEVHKAKCGNCHVRVEPGSRKKDQLEAAFPRHKSRVHLSEDEWSQMMEYLSAPSSVSGPSMQPLRGGKQG